MVSGLGRRVVPQLLVLHDLVADVDAEAGRAPVEPEAEDPVEFLPHRLAPPVEVGLGGQEVVEVVLAGDGIPGPGRAAEAGAPVVGR